MRIGIDIRDLTNPRPTGVGSYTENTIRAMARLAPFDTFILFASGTNATLDLVPRFHEPNIVVDARVVPNKLLSSLFATRVGPCLEDIVAEKPNMWLFPNPNIVRTRLPYAMTVHDLAPTFFPDFFPMRYRTRNVLSRTQEMARGAGAIFAVSQSTALDVHERWDVPEERIVVTPLGVDHARYGEREQANDRSFRAAYDLNRPYILSLATLEPRKNLISLVEAYDAFRTKGGRPILLVIAGGRGWKMRAFDHILKKAKYKHEIRLLGYVPEKHKPALYRGATAFVFPSFYEGFGLPVLEAMTCGTPVITSGTSSLPELTGSAALLVDPFNVTDLTQALGILVPENADGVRSALVKKGLLRAKQYSWDRTAEATLGALRALPR